MSIGVEFHAYLDANVISLIPSGHYFLFLLTTPLCYFFPSLAGQSLRSRATYLTVTPSQSHHTALANYNTILLNANPKHNHHKTQPKLGYPTMKIKQGDT